MAEDFDSKYSGAQVEALLDQVASGNAGGGGGGVTSELDPLFSASPAAGISAEQIHDWNEAVINFENLSESSGVYAAKVDNLEAKVKAEETTPNTIVERDEHGSIWSKFIGDENAVYAFPNSSDEDKQFADAVLATTEDTDKLADEIAFLEDVKLSSSEVDVAPTPDTVVRREENGGICARFIGDENGTFALPSSSDEDKEQADAVLATTNDTADLWSEWGTLVEKDKELAAALEDKVDKVSGKQLSTEDFTSALKTKLEGLSNYDDTELSDALSTLRGDFDALVSGDTTTAIKTFNEVIAFLDGIQDSQDLSSIIASIEQQIAGKQEAIEGLDDINEKLEVIDHIVDADGYLYSNGEKVDMRFTRSLIPVGTSIPASANLNTIDYLKVGKYYCSLNVDAATIKNCPVNVAFSMEVFNPLSTTVDNETTTAYTYRLRVLTQYDTGQQYVQFCKTTGTAGSWTYDSWYVTPRVKFTLASSKNDGTAAIGATTRGVYVDSTGEIKAMSYTLSKNVPSNAVFTDTNTKVTAVGNHYTPEEDTTQQIDAPSGEVVIGIKRDAAGHIVGVVTTPQSGGSGGGIAEETDPIFSASPAASITEEKKAEWDNKMDKVTLATVATSGSYNDLSDKPTIPSAVTESTVSGWGFTKNAGTITGVSANGTSVATSGVANIPAATTSAYGVTKLSSSTSSTSTTLAATASAVKAAYDLANSYKGTVTGVKINGSTKSPSSGTVDIGNVVTSIKINGTTKTPSSGVVDLGTIGGGSSESGGEQYEALDSSNRYFELAANCLYFLEAEANVTYGFALNLPIGQSTRLIIRNSSWAEITISSGMGEVVWANDVAPSFEKNTIEFSFTSISRGAASGNYILATFAEFDSPYKSSGGGMP